MFEHDFTINGKHATYVKYFCNETKLFRDYIDVYMLGAIFGLLYNRHGVRDRESNDRARIYADAFATHRSECVFLYRLAMLLDHNDQLTSEEKIDRAFRDDADSNSADKLERNMELFNEYVLGGIEYMYEQYIPGCHTEEDYINRAVEIMRKFKDDVSGAPIEDIIIEQLK